MGESSRVGPSSSAKHRFALVTSLMLHLGWQAGCSRFNTWIRAVILQVQIAMTHDGTSLLSTLPGRPLPRGFRLHLNLVQTDLRH